MMVIPSFRSWRLLRDVNALIVMVTWMLLLALLATKTTEGFSAQLPLFPILERHALTTTTTTAATAATTMSPWRSWIVVGLQVVPSGMGQKQWRLTAAPTGDSLSSADGDVEDADVAILAFDVVRHVDDDSVPMGTPVKEDSNSNSNDGWSPADNWNARSAAEHAIHDPARHARQHEDPLDRAAAVMYWSNRIQQKQQRQQQQQQQQLEGTTLSSDTTAKDAWLQGALDEILLRETPGVVIGDQDVEDLTDEDQQEESDPFVGSVASLQFASTPSLSSSALSLQEERQIARVIRCQGDASDLLVLQGRALPKVTDAERMAVSHLIVMVSNEDDNDRDQKHEVEARVPTWQMTPFFQQAVAHMFYQHCGLRSVLSGNFVDRKSKMVAVMDAAAVASWMTTSLQPAGVALAMGTTTTTTFAASTPSIVMGPYDRRVLATLSQYSQHGTGYLTLPDMERLYLHAVLGPTASFYQQDGICVGQVSLRELMRRPDAIRQVWRGLFNHGVESPADTARAQLVAEQEEQQQQQSSTMTSTMEASSSSMPTLLDECAIDDEEDRDFVAVGTTTLSSPTGTISITPGRSLTMDREGRSSHERVELAIDKKTPLWIRDGDFVFIDEESCIGCMQCTWAAPASFKMLDNGRARTFHQRRRTDDVMAAVQSCPVDCMHFMTFDELREMERARDHGDGRDDHRHFGHSDSRGYMGRTPLYVKGIESDANHRSSWYHYLKNKCCMSTQCPERGCYDCPRYGSEPGRNPFYQKHLQDANHIRAQHMIASGMADIYRKAADL